MRLAPRSATYNWPSGPTARFRGVSSPLAKTEITKPDGKLICPAGSATRVEAAAAIVLTEVGAAVAASVVAVEAEVGARLDGCAPVPAVGDATAPGGTAVWEAGALGAWSLDVGEASWVDAPAQPVSPNTNKSEMIGILRISGVILYKG
jgi:hypothetical protein